MYKNIMFETRTKTMRFLLQSKKSKVRSWTAARANFLQNLTGNMEQMKKVVGSVCFQHTVVC